MKVFGITIKTKYIITLFIVAFIIGFIVGKVIVHNIWKENVIKAVNYISEYDFKEKYAKNNDVNYIYDLIYKAKFLVNKEEYRKIIDILNEIQDLYPSLEWDTDFQSIIKDVN